MSDKRAPRRSLDDWMELVTEFFFIYFCSNISICCKQISF